MDSQTVRFECGTLTADDAGKHVELDGWVHRRRDHGGLIFIDLRDRGGITQVTFDPARREVFASAETLRNEDVVRVRGVVRRRPAGTENAKLATGEIEVPGRRARDSRTAPRRRRSSCRPTKSRRRRACGCAIAISICAGRGCSAT